MNSKQANKADLFFFPIVTLKKKKICTLETFLVKHWLTFPEKTSHL